MEFTKNQLFDIVLWYADDYSDTECPHTVEDGWCDKNIEEVEVGDDVVDYKTVYNSNVYKVGDIYFEVTFSRDNSGYWSDGERHEPTICEVVPKEIVKTIYVAAPQGEQQ